MGVITQAVMVQAAIDVNGMGQAQKVRLADEIFAQQPNLLASILALPRMGVGMVELEVPLHILFVTFQAMKRSGHVWPIVSEDVQDRCMQRLTARARFNEGLPGDLANQVVQQSSSSATNIPSATCSRSSTDTSVTTTCCVCAPMPRSSCCWPPSTSWSASPTWDPRPRRDDHGRGLGSRWSDWTLTVLRRNWPVLRNSPTSTR